MNNVESFNLIVGLAFADLYENFPDPIDLEPLTYVQKAGLSFDPRDVNRKEGGHAESAIRWLLDEGFIRGVSPKYSGSGVQRAVLTFMGLRLLSIPDSMQPQELIGAGLSKAARAGAREWVADLVKEAFFEGSKFAS